MKIAMLGLKGLPAVHGGIEKHVEELGARLAQRGHRVTVFCRRAYTPAPGVYRGMDLVLAPTIHTKHLDATVHTLFGSFRAAVAPFDLIHYHAIGPASMSFIARALGKPVIATIHSLDFLRDKWGPVAKWALRRAETATLMAAQRVVVVSRHMADRYQDSQTPVTVIPNGVSTPTLRPPRQIRERWSLQGGDYLFWAGRFSPEKGLHTLVDAFKTVKTDLRLVLAGGANHTESYVHRLSDSIKEDSRIVQTGYVGGDLLDELFTNAAGFILPSEHEGMPVALLEAMSFGLPCLVSDIPPCREIAHTGSGVLAAFFPRKDSGALAENLTDLLSHQDAWRDLGRLAQSHVLTHYTWDAIAGKVEKEYEALLGRR